MLINELIEKKNLTKYRLSKESGVPQATINDICSGKADLEKCSAGTLYKIAKVLNVNLDHKKLQLVRPKTQTKVRQIATTFLNTPFNTLFFIIFPL